MPSTWAATPPASPPSAAPPSAPNIASRNARPLRNRQGMWALIGEGGAVLKRGAELGPVLAPVERRLMKLVD